MLGVALMVERLQLWRYEHAEDDEAREKWGVCLGAMMDL
jgi:hypothetical protein